ncbi:nucleotidyltransferase family protein [Bacteroides sp. OttesenSCG-928-D19]|nr:nucleotidyltransferase family protein [Bacteroides sp. OttesenSCG-928-D19]
MTIDNYTLPRSATIMDALVKLNKILNFTLFVVDEEGKVLGSLTDGDIRRGLIAGHSPADEAYSICLKDFRYVNDANNSPRYIRQLYRLGIRLIPYLSPQGKIVKLIDLQKTSGLLPVDAVIMAGGRGERLRPLTDSLPKPLLPLGDKPIVEYNIDRMASYGITNITISVNYLGNLIKERFANGADKEVQIRYIDEDRPLGTLGAVSMVKHFTNEVVLVMNSDLFTNIDLEEFFVHFQENRADVAVASIPYNVTVPYAVMQTQGELISGFDEKPTFTYYSNAGIYLIRRELLEAMTPGQHCDATDFVKQAIDTGKRVTYFPIVGYWIDIGRPEDYRKAQEYIKFMKR